MEYERVDVAYSWRCKDVYILDRPEFHNIKQEIETRFNQYMGDIGVDSSVSFHITNSWVVKHTRGDWGAPHMHKNAIFSGLLYLNVDENSGKLTFHEKPSDRIFPDIFIIPINPTMITTKEITIQPENDSLYFFPSTLGHSISPCESDIERYVLVFNFWLKGKLGTEVGELTL
jgi:uncharacterized protein (TIGR02466 family)